MRPNSTKWWWLSRVLVVLAVGIAYGALAWRYDQWRGWHKTGTGSSSVEWFAALGDFLRDAPFGFVANTYGVAGLLWNAFGWALLCLGVFSLIRRTRHGA